MYGIIILSVTLLAVLIVWWRERVTYNRLLNAVERFTKI